MADEDARAPGGGGDAAPAGDEEKEEIIIDWTVGISRRSIWGPRAPRGMSFAAPPPPGRRGGAPRAAA